MDRGLPTTNKAAPMIITNPRIMWLFALASFAIAMSVVSIFYVDLGPARNNWISVICLIVSHCSIWVQFWRQGDNWWIWRRDNILKVVESGNIVGQLFFGVWVSRWEDNSWISIFLFVWCTVWSLSTTYAIRPPQDFGVCLLCIVCFLAQVTKAYGEEEQFIYTLCGVSSAVGIIPIWIRPRPREIEEYLTTIRNLGQQIQILEQVVQEAQEVQRDFEQRDALNREDRNILLHTLEQRKLSLQAANSRISIVEEQAEKARTVFEQKYTAITLERDELVKTSQVKENRIQDLNDTVHELQSRIRSIEERDALNREDRNILLQAMQQRTLSLQAANSRISIVEEQAEKARTVFEHKYSAITLERDELVKQSQVKEKHIQDLNEMVHELQSRIRSIEDNVIIEQEREPKLTKV